MSETSGYKVLPVEAPTYERVFLTEEEREKVGGLKFSIRVALWVGMLLVVTYTSDVLTAWLGFDPRDLPWVVLIIVLISCIAIPSIVLFFIQSAFKNSRAAVLEASKNGDAIAAYEREVSRAEVAAKGLTSNLLRLYESSTKLVSELQPHLDEAVRWLQSAEKEYHDNAFAPFWDAIENTAMQLSAFNDKATALAGKADEYYRLLRDRKHTFPVFPIQLERIPDAVPVARELQRVVRMGQTNFQFANIWELHRSRQTFGVAITNMVAVLENSVSRLQQSVTSDVAQAVAEGIKIRESLETRTVEQNRTPDNIRHHRESGIAN